MGPRVAASVPVTPGCLYDGLVPILHLLETDIDAFRVVIDYRHYTSQTVWRT